MMVIKLAKYEDIKAAVILHPGRLSYNDVNGTFIYLFFPHLISLVWSPG